MNMKTTEEIITYFGRTRNLKQNTINGYKIYLNEYSTYFNMSIVELLQEAEDEEEQGIRWKHRTLRKRLIEYRIYLYDKLAKSTAKARFAKLQAFYRHFEIEIHPLPPFSATSEEYTFKFTDLPERELLKKILKMTTPLMRAIILFMSSTGCARAETLNLTIQDFIDATKGYHNKDNIYEVINELKYKEDIVPLFYLRRQKTDKWFHTCASPEAVTEMIHYLIYSERTLKNNDPFFEVNDQEFIKKFRKINDTLGLGKLPNGKRKFTSHVLRKRHASYLKADNLNMDVVDELQGRSKDQTRSSYFFENPESLRQSYIEHLDCLTVNLDVNNIDFKSPEYVKMEVDLREKTEEVSKLNERVGSIEKILGELGIKDIVDKVKKE